MKTVTEIIDAIPLELNIHKVQRREELLLQIPSAFPMKLWRDYAPLTAIHFPQEYIPAKFAPPRDVFGGDFLRLEWQQMNGRQPFYHRNADVDEISYQVVGERTLITELGTTELISGDFSKIPVGIAHDNYGRNEIHLLFYIHAPTVECGQIVGRSEPKKLPFDGWTPAHVPEMMTECLGALGCDLSVSLADEELLLDAVNQSGEKGTRILVQRSVAAGSETQWQYKSTHVWIGTVQLNNAVGDVYQRHRRADAIQYQISGTRTLVTQRGTIEIEPGDFINIPKGCAYTSISAGRSSHILVLTGQSTPARAEATKEAKPSSIEFIAAARKRVGRDS